MAAPTVTARTTPTGYKLPDGYQTTLAFKNQPAVKLWEKAVKPPGLDSGDPIDTSTMHNVRYRTKAPRKLVTLGEVTINAAYDPECFTTIMGMLGVEDAITAHFPDGSTMAFWGFLQKFEYGDLKEGEFPEATVTVAVTNWDPVGKVEAGPVFAGSPGT